MEGVVDVHSWAEFEAVVEEVATAEREASRTTD